MSHWEESKILKLAIENASDHIIITDQDGVVLYANKAVEHVTGYSNKEVIGKRPNLWGGLMPKSFYTKFWKRLKKDKKDFVGEIKNRRKNGELYDAEIKVAPVLDKNDNVKFFVGIERDITKLKMVDKAKNEIISLTAHQLKNAPSTIKIFTDSLLDGIAGRLSKKQTRYIEEIRKANKNNINLITSLLNVTRLELGTFSATPQMVDLKKACQNVLKSQRVLIEEGGINVLEHYDKKLKPIAINPESLEILLQNLISNAIKYSDKGGQVTITVKMAGRPSQIHIIVSDTGCGIPKGDQSRVFSKLFRADNVRSKVPDGSGLGLYMVKLIVKKLHGNITFESREGEGTTFDVRFPINKKITK